VRLKISFYNIYETLNKNNYLFEHNNVDIGDNLMEPFVSMNDYAKEYGIELGTIEKIPIVESDVVVFVDCPNVKNVHFLEAIKSKKPVYLIILESPMIHPESHDLSNHSFFYRIFTWSDELILKDPEKYIKINFSHKIPCSISKSLKEKDKLCCMIAGNKKVIYKNELYSKRKQVIRWFEDNQVEDFDLYGFGWDEVTIGDNRYINFILRRSKFLRNFFGETYSSYRGSVVRKSPILKKYRFSICFENVLDIPGYITEKIFDSFFAGCVPIYLGANNIDTHIPSNCFIDMRDFNGIPEMYSFIREMSDYDYLVYLKNIENFLNSAKVEQFSSKYFIRTIMEEING
jgi:hypothetical protein